MHWRRKWQPTPVQCSCLENPRDGGPWWAAVYRVTQSPTRLKRLSSSRRAKSHFISAEMSLFETAVESPFAASTLVALRQVQGAEEESVLYGGKEEAGRGCLEQRSLQGNQSAAWGASPGPQAGALRAGPAPSFLASWLQFWVRFPLHMFTVLMVHPWLYCCEMIWPKPDGFRKITSKRLWVEHLPEPSTCLSQHLFPLQDEAVVHVVTSFARSPMVIHTLEYKHLKWVILVY